MRVFKLSVDFGEFLVGEAVQDPVSVEIYFDGFEGCDFGFGECQVFGSPKFLVHRWRMLRALGLGQKKTPASLFRRGIETAIYRSWRYLCGGRCI